MLKAQVNTSCYLACKNKWIHHPTTFLFISLPRLDFFHLCHSRLRCINMYKEKEILIFVFNDDLYKFIHHAYVRACVCVNPCVCVCLCMVKLSLEEYKTKWQWNMIKMWLKSKMLFFFLSFIRMCLLQPAERFTPYTINSHKRGREKKRKNHCLKTWRCLLLDSHFFFVCMSVWSASFNWNLFSMESLSLSPSLTRSRSLFSSLSYCCLSLNMFGKWYVYLANNVPR